MEIYININWATFVNFQGFSVFLSLMLTLTLRKENTRRKMPLWWFDFFTSSFVLCSLSLLSSVVFGIKIIRVFFYKLFFFFNNFWNVRISPLLTYQFWAFVRPLVLLGVLTSKLSKSNIQFYSAETRKTSEVNCC